MGSALQKIAGPLVRLSRMAKPVVAVGAALAGVFYVAAFYVAPSKEPKVRIVLTLEKSAPVPAPAASPAAKPLHVAPIPQVASGSQNTKGRIALIVTSLGMNEVLTSKAIKDLPTHVTMAFTPYTPLLKNFLTDSKANGHEALLLLPMEEKHYPLTDGGPLMLKCGDKKNIGVQLKVILAKSGGTIGLMDLHGGAFMQSKDDVTALFTYLRDQKILFIDSRSALLSEGPAMSTATKNPYISVTHILDSIDSPVGIQKAFETMASQAHVFSYAIGIIRATPFSMQLISEWAKTIKNQGLELVPLSAFVPHPGAPTSL